jgi:hypothetical protein
MAPDALTRCAGCGRAAGTARAIRHKASCRFRPADPTVSLRVRPEWTAAASYTGRPLAAWIASIVEEYLRTGPGRFVPLPPLRWRADRFRVILQPDGRRFQVQGFTAGPFGIYRSRYDGLPTDPEGFSLAHLPSSGLFVFLKRRNACKRLAEELAALRLRLDLTDRDKVVLGTPDAAKVPPIILRYRDADVPERMRG